MGESEKFLEEYNDESVTKNSWVGLQRETDCVIMVTNRYRMEWIWCRAR